MNALKLKAKFCLSYFCLFFVRCKYAEFGIIQKSFTIASFMSSGAKKYFEPSWVTSRQSRSKSSTSPTFPTFCLTTFRKSLSVKNFGLRDDVTARKAKIQTPMSLWYKMSTRPHSKLFRIVEKLAASLNKMQCYPSVS